MLTDDVVVLRPYEPEDLEVLFGLRNDLEVQKALLAQPTPNTRVGVEAWIQGKAAARDGAFFVIADAASGAAAGFVQFTSIHSLHGTCWSGIAVVREQQGKGIHGRAYALAGPYLRDVHGIRKIKVEVVGSNERSLRAFERIGFTRAGVLHREVYCDGGYQDVVLLEKFIEGHLGGTR